MSEIRRTEGGLIINTNNQYALLAFGSNEHGLELPELTDLGDDANKACESGDLFFQQGGKAVLALALSPRSADDRLHIFPGQDMWRTYLEYWLLTGGVVSIVVSHHARLSLEQAGVTTGVRTGISEEEIAFTDKQYAVMMERRAEAAAEAELRGLDFDEGISSLLADNNE